MPLQFDAVGGDFATLRPLCQLTGPGLSQKGTIVLYVAWAPFVGAFARLFSEIEAKLADWRWATVRYIRTA